MPHPSTDKQELIPLQIPFHPFDTKSSGLSNSPVRQMSHPRKTGISPLTLDFSCCNFALHYPSTNDTRINIHEPE
jgi:hypothetical protein